MEKHLIGISHNSLEDWMEICSTMADPVLFQSYRVPKKTFQLYEVYFVINLFCTALGMTMVCRLSGWWMVASERSYSRFVENESAHDLCPVQPAGERLNICLYNYSSNNSWWSKKKTFWAGTSSIRQEVVTLKQQNNPSVHVRVERHTCSGSCDNCLSSCYTIPA